MRAHVENVRKQKKKPQPPQNPSNLQLKNPKSRAVLLLNQYLNSCEVQRSKEDSACTYRAVVVLIPFFCALQIKRADLEPEIQSSTEETELFYNRGI